MAWPFSSGNRLTSPMMAPPLARIGSTSIGLVWSNTSHTVSARRNSAAGVGAAKENVTRRPSLSRLASTVAALSLAPLSGGGLDAAGSVFFGRLRGRWSLPGRYGLRRFRSGSLDLFGGLRRFRGFRRRRCFFR